jgi:hypothetical protein
VRIGSRPRFRNPAFDRVLVIIEFSWAMAGGNWAREEGTGARRRQ